MDRVSRRRLLALAGASALAGCLEGNSASTPPGSSADASSVDTDDPQSPSSDAADALPACPDYENDETVDRVVCAAAADPESEPVVLEASERTVAEGSSIEFTLRNDGDERLMTNFYNWRVDKYVDGKWYHVAPLIVDTPLMTVDPGDSHTWTVTPDNDQLADGGRFLAASGTESITLRGVGSGTYAFRARGWFEDARDEEILAFAATFGLEGEPLVLTPTDAITAVEWETAETADGEDVLVARSDRGEDVEDTERRRLNAYELEVLDEPTDDARSVIAEQVVRTDQLRDVIALAAGYDAAAVRLEEYDGSTTVFGRDSDGVYEYRGTYYRVRTRELEGEGE